jgi:hypothetical protein
MMELVSAIAKEVIDGSLSAAVHALLRRRGERARGILLSELEQGGAVIQDVDDVDPLAAMTFEYMNAAQRGSARMNLKLMAQVLAGQVQSPPLYADKFLRWSSLIASLSREEVIALGAYRRMWTRHEDERVRQLPDACKDRREVDAVIGPTKTFGDGSEFNRTLAALARTGLVVPVAAIGGLHYEPTGLLDELISLTDFEAALREPSRER